MNSDGRWQAQLQKGYSPMLVKLSFGRAGDATQKQPSAILLWLVDRC